MITLQVYYKNNQSAQLQLEAKLKEPKDKKKNNAEWPRVKLILP